MPPQTTRTAAAVLPISVTRFAVAECALPATRPRKGRRSLRSPDPCAPFLPGRSVTGGRARACLSYASQVSAALGPQRAQIALAGIRRVVGRPSAHLNPRFRDPNKTRGEFADVQKVIAGFGNVYG